MEDGVVGQDGPPVLLHVAEALKSVLGHVLILYYNLVAVSVLVLIQKLEVVMHNLVQNLQLMEDGVVGQDGQLVLKHLVEVFTPVLGHVLILYHKLVAVSVLVLILKQEVVIHKRVQLNDFFSTVHTVIPHGDQCSIDVDTDICAGDNTECRGGTCQCVAACETSTTTVSRCECQSSLDMKAVIVGVVLGLVILILVLYSGFVTLKLRRSIANNEQLRQAELNRKLQPTYMNDVFQNVTMPDKQVEGTENLTAEYTTLSDEAREAKSTYDIIRVQNDSV